MFNVCVRRSEFQGWSIAHHGTDTCAPFFFLFFSPLHQHKSYLKERDIRDDEWILHSINQLGERSAERETEKEREIPSFVCCPVAHIWFILPGVNTAWKNKKRRGMQGGWKKIKKYWSEIDIGTFVTHVSWVCGRIVTYTLILMLEVCQ